MLEPVKIETIDKEVELLHDTKVSYVSLVRHGANRQPFRIVKTEEKGGREKSMMVIQSIIIPKTTTLSKILEDEKLGHLSMIKNNGKEFEDFTKYTQIPVEKFDASTLTMIKVGETEAIAVVGEVTDSTGIASSDMLTLSKEELEKIQFISPMDTAIDQGALTPPSSPSLIVSFRELFDREVSGLMDVIYGTLRQTVSDAKKRKTNVLNAVDAFRNFLAASLDMIGGSEVKMEKPLTKTDKGGNGIMSLFKDENEKQEFATEVTGIVCKVLTDLETLKAANAPVAVTKTSEVPEVPGVPEDKRIDELLTLVKSVAGKVEVIEKKHETLENQLASETGSDLSSDEGKVIKKEDAALAKKSVFSGLLVGTQK